MYVCSGDFQQGAPLYFKALLGPWLPIVRYHSCGSDGKGATRTVLCSVGYLLWLCIFHHSRFNLNFV